MAHVCKTCLDSYSRYQKVTDNPINLRRNSRYWYLNTLTPYYEFLRTIKNSMVTSIKNFEFRVQDFCQKNYQLVCTLEKISIGIILFWIFYQSIFKYLTYFLWNIVYILWCVIVSGLLFIFLLSQNNNDEKIKLTVNKNYKKFDNYENYRKINKKISNGSLSDIDDNTEIKIINNNKFNKKSFVNNKNRIKKRRKLDTIVREFESDSDTSCLGFRKKL